MEDYDIGIDDFFKYERNITYKFSSLLQDVNSLQRVILKGKGYDISRFISLCAQAFLPKVVFQLEEYGLPHMISKKLQKSRVIDFYNKDLTIHKAIDIFNEIGLDNVLKNTADIDDFDTYILDYFYEGIKITNA